MNIFPFSCLAIFNLQIYFQIRKANQERAKLSRLQQREIGLATMLICVVIVFFACNILAVVNNVLEVSIYIYHSEGNKNWTYALYATIFQYIVLTHSMY